MVTLAVEQHVLGGGGDLGVGVVLELDTVQRRHVLVQREVWVDIVDGVGRLVGITVNVGHADGRGQLTLTELGERAP